MASKSSMHPSVRMMISDFSTRSLRSRSAVAMAGCRADGASVSWQSLIPSMSSLAWLVSPTWTTDCPPADTSDISSSGRNERASPLAISLADWKRVVPFASFAFMLAELSKMRTMRRCEFFCQLQSGSMRAPTRSSTKASCSRSDNQ